MSFISQCEIKLIEHGKIKKEKIQKPYRITYLVCQEKNSTIYGS